MYSCHLFLISSASVRSILASVLCCAHLCMKCSLGISDFLEEICSFPHSIAFPYFFVLFTLKGFLKKGTRALVIGCGINSRTMSGSGPGHGDLPAVGTFGLSLRRHQTVDKFWKSLIKFKVVLAVGTHGGAELWHPLFLPGEGWHSLGWDSLPPALQLSRWSSVIFLTSALSPWLFSLGFLHLSGLSHLVSRLLPAASFPLDWSPFPFPCDPRQAWVSASF